jgi:ABC-type nickel/cobalt efflux system permease component RcnA
MQLLNQQSEQTTQGYVGIMASVVSVLASHLNQIEIGVRLLTQVAGLLVTVLTIVSLWRGLRRKKRSHHASAPDRSASSENPS